MIPRYLVRLIAGCGGNADMNLYYSAEQEKGARGTLAAFADARGLLDLNGKQEIIAPGRECIIHPQDMVATFAVDVRMYVAAYFSDFDLQRDLTIYLHKRSVEIDRASNVNMAVGFGGKG